MNKKVLSIIGAFLGGLVFSIPWVVVYVLGNYIMSILAFLIALGAYIFYKKFGGEVTKKTSITIGVISLVIVTFLVFIVIPLALMVSEGHGFNFAYLGVLYSDSEFVSAIISDYVVSVIFTLLGISGVVASINKDAYGVINDSEYLEEDDEEKVIKELKKVYDYYKAYDKKTAIPDSVLFSNIKVKNPNRLKSNYIKRGVIVLASANKTYFDEEAILNLEKASSNYKKFKRRTFRIILLSVIFLAFVILAALGSVDDELTYKTYSYDDISIKLPDYFTKDDTVKDEDGYAYFEGYQSDNKIGVEGVILEYYDTDYTLSEVKDVLIEYIEEGSKIIETKEVTVNNMDAYLIVSNYKDYIEQHSYMYLFSSGKKAYSIELIYNKKNESKFLDNQQTILDSIRFNFKEEHSI